MSDTRLRIPSSVLRHLDQVPSDRGVAMLIRHSAREDLAPDDVGYELPITALGREMAVDLGSRLRGQIKTLHSSPLLRCTQTAEALAEGAEVDIPIIHDRLLGDPGAFVIDGELAWENWQRLGHEGVMRHLVTESFALPGMAKPDDAANSLLTAMLSVASGGSGIHIFVSHDSVVTATAARLLGKQYGIESWPEYLEAAFFWLGDEGVCIRYKDDASELVAC